MEKSGDTSAQLGTQRFRRHFPLRVLLEFHRDPGENRSVAWAAFVNDIAASQVIPARLRTLLYRLGGCEISLRALVRPGVIIRDSKLVIGSGSTINYGCVFDNREGVEIGRNVGVGIGVKFINTDHDLSDPDRRAGTGRSGRIIIGDGAYIGSGALIMAGVRVGRGAVIGAGAVVTHDCQPHGLYLGVPARHSRDLPTDKPGTTN